MYVCVCVFIINVYIEIIYILYIYIWREREIYYEIQALGFHWSMSKISIKYLF